MSSCIVRARYLVNGKTQWNNKEPLEWKLAELFRMSFRKEACVCMCISTEKVWNTKRGSGEREN